MSSTKSQVAVATNIPNISSSNQPQKEYNAEESLGRQNSFGLSRRGTMKGKHLTRSHAMREATSPPRTPTPRASDNATSSSQSQMSPNGYQQSPQLQQPNVTHHHQIDVNDNNTNANHNNNNNNSNSSNNKLHTQSSATRGNSPIIDTPTVIVTSQHKQQQLQPQQQQHNVALCNETEFPKLTPPKSKGGGAGSGATSAVGAVATGGSGVCTNNNGQQQRPTANIEGSVVTSNTNMSNKKTNGDSPGGLSPEAQSNKATVNVVNSSNNKNYNQSQPQQQQQSYNNAGNALQKALKMSDNSQQQHSTSSQSSNVYNSPMNYQLHPNDGQQQQQSSSAYIAYEKENRCPRNDSQNSVNSGDEMHYMDAQQPQQQQHNQHHQQQQQHNQHQQQRVGGGGGGKKHRTNSNSKSLKPRLKNMGGASGGNASSSGSGPGGSVGPAGGPGGGGGGGGSMDGSLNSSNNTSGFISRENSNEQYTDHGGTDLLSFFKETLNKNIKDRQFLLNVEKDLIEFVQEGSRGEIRFPQASSYNRMLIHRTAAFFGMEHNVDTETQQCVIVAPTKNTRIPDIRFKTLVNSREDSRKSILKRDTHSFDEARQSSYLCPDRGGMLDRKAKSFEEREEDYDRARSRIFNRTQNEACGGGSTDDESTFISWTSTVEHQQYLRGRSSGKAPKIQNSPDGRSGSVVSKGNTSYNNYGPSHGGGGPLMRGDSVNSNKGGGNNSGSTGASGNRAFSKQDSTGSTTTSWRLSPSSSGTVYHFDPSNMPPPQVIPSGGNNSGASSGSSSMYHSNQSSTSPQQHVTHNNPKKQHNKGHAMSQTQQPSQLPQPKCQQQFNTIDSTTSTASGGETVSAESATQTINVAEEEISKNLGDVNYVEDTITKDDNDDCDNNSVTGCLSITTTTSTKNYDRIEVQKFKNQATSPNIPNNDKDDIPKFEHSSQTPTNAVVVTPSQQQQTQHRETPHSARSTPFSNSDTLTKRSSEEPRTTSWAQGYQAPDGSTVFHTNATPTGSNPYCTTTYQQGPDGSIYAVPQGMIYAYQPPPVEGEFQGYFMPVFDPSQQRAESTSLIQSGAQAIYPTGGTATMVPVAAYPTAQFTTTNGAPIYPGQVIYSGEQFAPASAPLAAAAPATAAGQLQQIPMTTYPIGYPYPYNGYWGQTMTYYVPQQAVPATSLLTAQPPPQTVPSVGSHVAGGVNISGPTGPNSTAGPSMNSSNATSQSGASAGCVPNNSHLNGPTGYQPHGSSGVTSGGSHNNNGTTYYGTGRIKRSNPPHFTSGAPQVMTATAIQNGVSATTYQMGHAVPTLTLAATGPAGATAGMPGTSDLSTSGATPATTTMYALPQHATIFPTNMFPYAANAAQAIAHQPTANMGQQTTLISQHGAHQVQTTALGHHANAAAAAATGAIHNPHHSNTVITPFYTTTHHHNPHAAGIHSGGHTIHAPGPAAIPIVDPASLINVSQSGQNTSYGIRGVSGNGGNSGNSTSQSAPSTPHSMPSSAPHYSQRNPPAFSTPPIMNNNNGGGYNSASSTPQYYSGGEQNHGANSSNSPHNSYTSSSYEKRNNNTSGGKKSLAYQSVSLSRQNSTNAGSSYTGSNKSTSLLGGGGNNNDTRASPGSNSTNSRPHSIKRSVGGGGSGGNTNANEKPQTPLLSGPPTYAGNANVSNSGYQTGTNVEITPTGVLPAGVSVAKPPIRLNAAAAAFRHKGSSSTATSNTMVEYRRNPASQRNSPSTNASSSNDNSNNNSPNSIHNNSSNAATPITAGCYAPTYVINAQNNGAGDGALGHPPPPPPPSLYITTTTARGPAHHIPPHLQTAASAAAPTTAAQAAAAAASNAAVTQQTNAVLGGAAAAAAAADVANAAAVAAATVAHHHHHPQPLLGTYNPGASGLYFKYGHTYFAHPSVALPNSRRSPSTDLRPPIAQVAGMYPTVNMMIPGMPAQPRHPGRHPNPNYKGTRPR